MPPKSSKLWIEYAAALWALIFALLHVAWALGWYIGLDAEAASRAFARGWFLAYDLIAAALCLIAVAVALAQLWGRRLPRVLVSAAVWSCALILTLRAGLAICQAIYSAAAYGISAPVLSFWDWWFCLGAVLFAASARKFRRAHLNVEFLRKFEGDKE